jgi:alpha-1,6-mannosyltransferase
MCRAPDAGREPEDVPGRLAALVLWLARRSIAKRLRPAAPPRSGVVAIAVSVALVATTAVLGPSAAVEPLPGRLPLSWHAHPPAAVVTVLLAAAVVAGSWGLLRCLNAVRTGWAVDPRRLVWGSSAAAVVLALLPPVGSADAGSYAAYGELAATGRDPYAMAPSALTGAWHAIAEPPWANTKSVYGPLATGEQWLAAKLAGSGAAAPAHAVLALDLAGALAFVVTGLLLQRLAAGSGGRRRVALLYSANPLVLFEGVAGGHLDVVLTMFAVAAVALLAARRTPLLALLAGLAAGAATAVKASGALVAAALAWAARVRGPDRLARPAAVAIGAAGVLVPAYLLAGGHAFDQLGTASGFVSFADPWRIVTHPLEAAFGHGAARVLIRTAAWLLFAVLALLLFRGLPGGDIGTGVAAPDALGIARCCLVLVFAWLLTAPYVLPWYAVPAFAFLALLPRSGYDTLLVAWTAVLALAYLPGRDVRLPTAVHAAVTSWKSGAAPVLLLGIGLAAAVLSLRGRG